MSDGSAALQSAAAVHPVPEQLPLMLLLGVGCAALRVRLVRRFSSPLYFILGKSAAVSAVAITTVALWPAVAPSLELGGTAPGRLVSADDFVTLVLRFLCAMFFAVAVKTTPACRCVPYGQAAYTVMVAVCALLASRRDAVFAAPLELGRVCAGTALCLVGMARIAGAVELGDDSNITGFTALTSSQHSLACHTAHSSAVLATGHSIMPRERGMLCALLSALLRLAATLTDRHRLSSVVARPVLAPTLLTVVFDRGYVSTSIFHGLMAGGLLLVLTQLASWSRGQSWTVRWSPLEWLRHGLQCATGLSRNILSLLLVFTLLSQTFYVIMAHRPPITDQVAAAASAKSTLIMRYDQFYVFIRLASGVLGALVHDFWEAWLHAENEIATLELKDHARQPVAQRLTIVAAQLHLGANFLILAGLVALS